MSNESNGTIMASYGLPQWNSMGHCFDSNGKPPWHSRSVGLQAVRYIQDMNNTALARIGAVAGSLIALTVLGTWLVIRLWMGLDAGMPAPWQVYRFAVAAVLVAPPAIILIIAARRNRIRQPGASRDYVLLATLSIVWIFVAGIASAVMGL